MVQTALSSTKITKAFRQLLSLFTCMAILLSCATLNPSEKGVFDIKGLEVDPLECTQIRMRSDIAIKKEIIHEDPIMQRKFLLVLRYREGGDEHAFSSALLAGYNNISLVSEMETGYDAPVIVYRRYCVIEKWTFLPDRNLKLCYLWTIGEDSVEMKLLLERIDGEYLDERVITLTDSDTLMLKDFYRKLTMEIIEKLKDPEPQA